MCFHHPLLASAARTWPPCIWTDVTVVVAVSGGPDSVALLRALVDLRRRSTPPDPPGRLIVAHFNHRLRGLDSDRDARFVGELCRILGVACVQEAAAPGDGAPSEQAARDQRYRFLKRVADAQGARFLAVGHTADDQVETILHHIVRGTGLAGLAGIPAQRPLSGLTTLVRPLLQVSRSCVADYLNQIEQAACRDQTNDQLAFTRNRIRHQLIPHLRSQYNPAIDEAVRRLGEIAADAYQIVQRQIQRTYVQAVKTCRADQAELDCRLVDGLTDFELAELMILVWKDRQWPRQQMGHEKWTELVDLVRRRRDHPHSLTLPGAIRARVAGDCLTLRRADSDPTPLLPEPPLP